MPQELLDGPQVGTGLQEVGGEGVAQGVGMNPPVEGHLAGAPVQDPADGAGAQASAPVVEEDRIRAGEIPTGSLGPHLVPGFQPLREGLEGLLAEGDDPLLPGPCRRPARIARRGPGHSSPGRRAHSPAGRWRRGARSRPGPGQLRGLRGRSVRRAERRSLLGAGPSAISWGASDFAPRPPGWRRGCPPGRRSETGCGGRREPGSGWREPAFAGLGGPGRPAPPPRRPPRARRFPGPGSPVRGTPERCGDRPRRRRWSSGSSPVPVGGAGGSGRSGSARRAFGTEETAAGTGPAATWVVVGAEAAGTDPVGASLGTRSGDVGEGVGHGATGTVSETAEAAAWSPGTSSISSPWRPAQSTRAPWARST